MVRFKYFSFGKEQDNEYVGHFSSNNTGPQDFSSKVQQRGTLEASKYGNRNKTSNRTKRGVSSHINIEEEEDLHYAKFLHYNTSERNLKNFIELKCVDADSYYCKILKRNWNSEVENLITKNGLSECAIVKMVKHDCGNYPKNDLNCTEHKLRCSLPDVKDLKPSDLRYWFQNFFKVTEKNENQVKQSPHRMRYTCITPEANEGIVKDGICIKTTSLSLGHISNDIYSKNFVLKYILTNLKNYTILPDAVAKRISYYYIPNSTAIYSKFGAFYFKNQETDVYILPFPLKITAETIYWMSFSKKMADAICNALKIRKLEKEEIDLISNLNIFLSCFYNQNGKRLSELSYSGIVWSFGPDAATNQNYANIPKGALEIAKKRDILFSLNKLNLGNDWVQIDWNIYIKKEGSRALKVETSEFYSVLEFNGKFLKQKEFLIMECDFVVEKYIPKIDYLVIDNCYLFYNSALMNSKQQLTINIEQLKKSTCGQKFLLGYSEITKNTWIKIEVKNHDCKKLQELRKHDKLECWTYGFRIVE